MDKIGESGNRSFIEEARRKQIVSATIATLAELGYVNASLAKIAKTVGISTSLISYHFADKDELVGVVLEDIVTRVSMHLREAVSVAVSCRDKLRNYIQAYLAFVGTQPEYFVALLEIVFNVRTPEGKPLYKEDMENPIVEHLEHILDQGQESGEFRSLNSHALAIALNGAMDQFLSYTVAHSRFDLETYTMELVEAFDRATRRDNTGRDAP